MLTVQYVCARELGAVPANRGGPRCYYSDKVHHVILNSAEVWNTYVFVIQPIRRVKSVSCWRCTMILMNLPLRISHTSDTQLFETRRNSTKAICSRSKRNIYDWQNATLATHGSLDVTYNVVQTKMVVRWHALCIGWFVGEAGNRCYHCYDRPFRAVGRAQSHYASSCMIRLGSALKTKCHVSLL